LSDVLGIYRKGWIMAALLRL